MCAAGPRRTCRLPRCPISRIIDFALTVARAVTRAPDLSPMSVTAQDDSVLEAHFCERGLRIPDRLGAVYGSGLADRLTGVLCMPCPAAGGRAGAPDIRQAQAIIDGSEWPLLPNLVPIAVLDEKSFACVVASGLDDDVPLPGEGAVVRWHLDVKQPKHQAAVLDTDCYAYVASLAEELEAREEGLRRILDEIGPAYELEYLEAGKRPRDFVLRPVRIACQNVVVALGAFAHDSSFDGLAVVAWQTCEVPHVGAHEANRALTALMLCDAFQSGGTMEIRFDAPTRVRATGTTAKSGQSVSVDQRYEGHPEGAVPASLRRFGRTVGVELGSDAVDPDSSIARISPAQARRLFLAITPMPDDLAGRVAQAVEDSVATPERLCFTLLSQVWREIELDFMLAVSPRAGSIISGGAPHANRAERQAESEIARAALMVGMLYRRLDSKDGAGAAGTEARVLEDNRVGVTWEVDPTIGAVRLCGLAPEPLPWNDCSMGEREPPPYDATLTVVPRLTVDAETCRLARELTASGSVAVVVPHDADVQAADLAASGCALLRCPERLAELDQQIERKLLQSRISRA